VVAVTPRQTDTVTAMRRRNAPRGIWFRPTRKFQLLKGGDHGQRKDAASEAELLQALGKSTGHALGRWAGKL
jgi:hypothetical protein